MVEGCLSILDFVEQDNVETERRNRIRLAVFAYAYEFENDSLVSDGEFDRMSEQVDPKIKTGNKLLDTFFTRKFDACTGQWIHDHPELDKIRKLYHKFYKDKERKE